MIIEIEKMLPEEIQNLISVLGNELVKKRESKTTIDLEVLRERKEVVCPYCNSKNIKKNGKYKDRQLYKCKDCKKKFNSLTNTPFHHTRLTYSQICEAYNCLVNKVPIRKMANKLEVSVKTAFILRFKIISCLKEIANNVEFKGEAELDEYYLPINLKGTKTKNMPRFSKKRQKNGTGKGGITKHTVCVTSGVDSYDNMIFKVAGTSNVSSDMIENTIAKYVPKGCKVTTDCKSSYESIAKKYNWNLKQVKAKCYVDEEGNNLATINSLHSELDHFFSGFRGVSTKHLPEYLDYFVYLKQLNYKKEYKEQPKAYKKDTITLNSLIKYNNVFDNYSNIDFKKVYEDYSQPPKCLT